MKCGMGISQRFIPIHSLYHKLQKSVINSLLKLQILTRRDVTSKVGIKLAAMKASEEVNLWKFCSFESKEYGFKKNLYFVKILHGKSTCSTFNELPYATFLLLFFQLIRFPRYSKQQKSDMKGR